VSRAKSAVPAYLLRMAGRTSAPTPRLQPPRSLFAPLTGAEPGTPAAGGHTGPVHFGSGIGQPGPAPRSFVAEIPASRGPSEAHAQDGASLAAPSPVRGAMAAVPPAEGSRSGPALNATVPTAQEPDTPGSTPDRTAPTTPNPQAGSHRSTGRRPLAAPPLAPLSAAAVAPGPPAPAPGAAPSEKLPTAARTEHGMGPSPAPIPAGSPKPTAVPTKSPLPAAAPALLPPKQVRSATEISEYPGLRRPRPVNGSAASAQVSIGTIEVTIVPPAPTPSPISPRPPHQRARPEQVGTPRRAGVDAARQAARGAARRWFGAGQS
jgi:hypothetical protein